MSRKRYTDHKEAQMAKRQGLNRLQRGVARRLSTSELARGYVYFTADPAATEMIDVDSFTVEWLGVEIPERRLVRGRFQVPKRLMAEAEGITLRFGLPSRGLLVVSPDAESGKS
jgi:hypothetical protein